MSRPYPQARLAEDFFCRKPTQKSHPSHPLPAFALPADEAAMTACHAHTLLNAAKELPHGQTRVG